MKNLLVNHVVNHVVNHAQAAEKDLFTFSQRLRVFGKSVMQFLKWPKLTEQIFAESAESAKSAKSAKSAMPIFVSRGIKDSRVKVGQYPTNTQLISNLSLTVDRYLLRYAAMVLFILTIGVGNVWGEDVTSTFTLSSDVVETAFSITDNDVTWSGNRTAIGQNANGSMLKVMGTITVALPTGATLKSVTATLNNASGWGKSVTLTFKAGTTSLVSWAKNGSSKAVTISSNQTAGTYTFVGKGNAWVTSLSVKYTPGSGSTPTCATPAFSPAEGSYIGTQSVTISSTTTGSTIYYTTDGSTPTTGSAHGTAGEASATVSVSSNMTLKAIAVKDGANNSTVGTATYSIVSCSGDEFSWNLATNSYDASPTDELIKWTGTYATMQNSQGSGTKVTNYIPTSYSSTRFYSGNTLTITPATGVTISHVVFTATTDGYASVLRNSTWTNATASGSGTYVIVTPTDGTTAFSAAVGGTCGFTNVYVCYTAAACDDDPTIGTAQLNGTFNSSSVGVTATSWAPGTNCSWEDYGFVWGTSANPTISDNKVQVGTSGSATTWDGALTGSFTVGATYHYRAYGKNGKASAAYYYSSDATFTPRSITFNMNGHGDAPATQYVNDGGKATEPAAPTATGYIFGGWYKESGCTNAWNFSSDVVSGANKTIYAKWYTVTVQKQDETGATIADAGVTATFGAASALTASAGSTNYVFKGWKFSGSSNGTSIASATSASTTLTGTPTGDVIVIAEFYKPITVTWLVGTTSAVGGTTEVKYNNKITALPSTPSASTLGSSCSDLVFQGWSTSNLGAASGQSAPSDLFTSAGDAGVTNLTSATTYRAVFAEAGGSGPITWTQVTSVSVGDEVVIAQIDDGTTELNGFNAAITNSDNYGTSASFTTNPAGTMVWTVEAGNSADQFSFKNGDYYLNLPSNANRLNGSSTKSANSSWTITTSNSRAKITNAAYSSRSILFKTTGRFASYAKKHGDYEGGDQSYYYYAILYKKSGGISYSNYVTSCDPNQVTVRYDANGGNTVCESATYDKTLHQSHTVCSNNPTHPESHHVFVKWCVNVDGSGAEYRAGDVISDVQEDITLYAMWRIECEKLATPTNISKTVTTHSISLTWDAVPNATGYEIVIRDEDKGTQHKKTTNTNPAFSTSTLEDAHNYSYKITAKGDGGTYYCDSDPAGPTAFSTPEATKYTVTFKPGSGTCATASLVTDQIKSMPIATSKCEGWTFVGWSTTKASTDPENPTTSRPALITASSLSPYEPTSDVTLYAVYEGTSSTGGDYVLVESDLGSDWSGKYCIGYDATTFMDGALAGGTDAGHIGGANEAANPGANLSSKTIAKAWGDAHCLTLQKNDEVYTLQTLTGSYIYRIGTKNGMNSSSVVADATTNGLTVEWVDAAEDYLEIASSGGPTLQYSTNTTNGYFRYYASEQNTLKFYKQAGGGKAYVHDAGCVECEDATATFERPALTLTLEGTSSSILAAPNTYTSTNTSAKTYSSSNTSVATVNASTGALTLVGAGETIIKVTQPRSGNETDGFICPASAQYTLTVKAPTVDIVGIADNGNGIVIEHDLDGGVIHIDELVPVTEGETATELFFSKYYEAANNVKMVAIFNGTDHAISLEDIRIRILGDYPQSFMVREVFESLPEQLDANKEVVLLAWQKSDSKDLAIIGCADDNSKWSDWYKYAYSWRSDNGHTLAFGGKAAIILERVNEETGTAEMLDLIGAINNDGTINTTAVSKPSWGDSQGWSGTGLKINSDSEEMELSTNRCLLLRDKKVTSGKHAVEANTGSGNFVTLGKHLVDGKYVYEWHGDTIHVGDKSSNSTTDSKSDVYSSCNGFQQIAEYDYRNYYVDEQSRDAVYTSKDNGDGTQTIDFDKGTDLSTYSCKIFNIQVKKGDEVRLEQTYKVPIIVMDGAKSTDNAIFSKFTAEQCADCDVVVLGSGSLAKLDGTSSNDRPTVRNLEVYAGAKMSVPAGKTYSVQSLRMRGTNQLLPEVKLAASATLTNRSGNVWYDRRIDEDHWYWLTLPYDVNTTDITFVDGTPAVLNSDYFIQYYDGAKRATTQTGGNWIEISGDRPLRAGEGYLIGVTPRHGHDFMELRFPMAGVVEAEFSNKDVPVDGNTVKDGIRANHVGWNLIGNPFMAGFKRGSMPTSGLTTGKLVKVMEGGKWTGLWESNADGTPYVTMRSDIDGNDYYQDMVSNVDLNAFDCFFIQLGDKDANAMSFPTAQRNLKPAYVREAEEDVPFRTGVRLTGVGYTDHTGLLIGEGYTPAYEYNADLFKEFGSVYSLKAYTIQSDGLPLAYNAMAPESTENIPLGYRAPQKGSYVFKLDDSYSIDRIEALYLTDHVLNTTVNLLNTDYGFETERTQNNSRFTLSVVAKKPGTATGLGNTDANGKYYLTAVGHTLVLSGLDETADIYVYDINGRLIRSEKSYNGGAIWRTEVPATGVYFVGISSLNGEQTLRTIVK